MSPFTGNALGSNLNTTTQEDLESLKRAAREDAELRQRTREARMRRKAEGNAYLKERPVKEGTVLTVYPETGPAFFAKVEVNVLEHKSGPIREVVARACDQSGNVKSR